MSASNVSSLTAAEIEGIQERAKDTGSGAAWVVTSDRLVRARKDLRSLLADRSRLVDELERVRQGLQSSLDTLEWFTQGHPPKQEGSLECRLCEEKHRISSILANQEPEQ